MIYTYKLNFVFLVCILWYYVKGSEVNNIGVDHHMETSIAKKYPIKRNAKDQYYSIGTSKRSDGSSRSDEHVRGNMIFRDQFLLLIVRADLVPMNEANFPNSSRKLGEDSVKYYVNREQLYGDYYLQDVTAMRRYSDLDRYFLKFQMRQKTERKESIWNCVSFVYVESIGNVVDAAHCKCRNDLDAYRFYDIENCEGVTAALGVADVMVVEDPVEEERLATLGVFHYFKDVPIDFMNVTVNEASRVISGSRSIYGFKSAVTFQNGTVYDCVTAAYIDMYQEGFYTDLSKCEPSLVYLSIEMSMKEVLKVDHPLSRYQAQATNLTVKALDLINVRHRYLVKFRLRDVQTGRTYDCESAVDTINGTLTTAIAARCDGLDSYGPWIVNGLYDKHNIHNIEATLFEQNLALRAASRYSPDIEFQEKSIKIMEAVRETDYFWNTFKAVLKFRVADSNGIWYDCLTLAPYDADYNRSDVVAVDCRNDTYPGRGVFSTDDFRPKYGKATFNTVGKQWEYKVVNRSAMYGSVEFVAGMCLKYYTKKEKLVDRHLVMDVTKLLIKDVYTHTHYQYYMSFLIENKRTGEILSCVAAAFAGSETVRGLLVDAVHCKGKKDKDAYRFDGHVINDVPEEYNVTKSKDGKFMPKISNREKRRKKQKPGKIVPLSKANSEIVEITHFENELALEALIWFSVAANTKFTKRPLVIKAQRQYVRGRYRYRLHFSATAPNKTEYDCDATGYASKTFTKYGIDYAICETGKRDRRLDSSKSLLDSKINERSFRTNQRRSGNLWGVLGKKSMDYYKKKQAKLIKQVVFQLLRVTSVRRKNIYGTTQYQFFTFFKINVYRSVLSKEKKLFDCKSSAFYSRKYCTITINAVHCECRRDGDAKRFTDRRICKRTTTATKTTRKTTKTRRRTKPPKRDKGKKWPRPSLPNPIAGTVNGFVALFAFFAAAIGTVFASVTAHFGSSSNSNSNSTSGLPDVSVLTYYETAPNGTTYFCATIGKFVDNVFVPIDTDCSYPSEDDYLPYETARYESITKGKFAAFEWSRNDSRLRRMITRSVRYYTETEQLDDNFQPGRANEFRRRPLYNGTLYQYYVNFVMIKIENGEVWNCTSSVYDIKNSTHAHARSHIMVIAAHCDCKNDTDLYRFPDLAQECGFPVDVSEYQDAPTDYAPPPIRKEFVEPTKFELDVARTGARWRWARKGDDYDGLTVQVKQAERAVVSYYGDHYEYTLIAHVIAPNGTLFECVLLANVNLNFIDYRVVAIDCRHDGYQGDGLVNAEDFLSEDIKYDVIIKREFIPITNASLLERLSNESVKYYRKNELSINSYQVVKSEPLLVKTIYNGTQYQYFISFELAAVEKNISYHFSSSAFARKNDEEVLINAVHCDCIKDIDAHRFYFNYTTDCTNKQVLDETIVEVTTFEARMAKQAASHYSLDAPRLFTIEVVEAIRLRHLDGYGYKLKFQMTSQDAMLLCTGKGSVSFDYRNPTIENVTCRKINASELHNWQDYFTFGDVKFDAIDESEFTRANEASSVSQKLLNESVVYYVRLEGFAASKGIRITHLYRRTTYKETQYQYFVRFLMETTTTMEEVGCSSSVFVGIDSEEMIVGAVHCDCRPDFNAYRFNQSDEVCFNEIEELVLPTLRAEIVEITNFELALADDAGDNYWPDITQYKYYSPILVRNAARVLYEKNYFYKIRMKVTVRPFTEDYDCIGVLKASLGFDKYNHSFTDCASYDNFGFGFYTQREYLFHSENQFGVIAKDQFYPVGVGLLKDSVLSKLRNNIIEYYQKKQHNPYDLFGLKGVYRKSIYSGTQYQYFLTVEMKNIDTDEWSNCNVSLFSRLNHQIMLLNAVHCNCRNDIDAHRFDYGCEAPAVTNTMHAEETPNVSIAAPQVHSMILARKASAEYFSLVTMDRDIHNFWINIKRVLRKTFKKLYRYKILFQLRTSNHIYYNCFALGSIYIDYTNYHIDIVDCISLDGWYPGKGLIRNEDYNNRTGFVGGAVVKAEEPVNEKFSSKYWIKYGDSSIEYYITTQNLSGNYFLKEHVQMYGKHLIETQQYHIILYFRIDTFQDIWNCTSSILTSDKDPSVLIVSAVHCACKNDSDAYRFEDKENCSAITSLPLLNTKDLFEAHEPSVHQMKLAQMATRRSLSISSMASFWFNIIEVLSLRQKQRVANISITYLEFKIKYQARAPDRTLYECFATGRIDVDYFNITAIVKYDNYSVETVNCGHDWYPDEQQGYFSRSKNILSQVLKTGAIIQIMDDRAKAYGDKIVQYYTIKEQLSGYYRLRNVEEIRQTKVTVGTVQYEYVISLFMITDNRTVTDQRDTWECTSLVYNDFLYTMTMVSAVHCACRNDTDAYRFKNINTCK